MIYVKAENSSDPITSETSSEGQLTINEVKTELNESDYLRLESKSSWMVDHDSGSLNFMNSSQYTSQYPSLNWPDSVLKKHPNYGWTFQPGVLTGWIGTEGYNNATNLFFIAKPQSDTYPSSCPVIPELYLECANSNALFSGSNLLKVGDKRCEDITDFNNKVTVNTRFINVISSKIDLNSISNLPYFLEVSREPFDAWYFLTECYVIYFVGNAATIWQTCTVLNSPTEYAYKKFVRVFCHTSTSVTTEVDWHEV